MISAITIIDEDIILPLKMITQKRETTLIWKCNSQNDVFSVQIK